VFPLATEYSEWNVQSQLGCAITTLLHTLLSLENNHPLVATAEGKAVQQHAMKSERGEV